MFCTFIVLFVAIATESLKCWLKNKSKLSLWKFYSCSLRWAIVAHGPLVLSLYYKLCYLLWANVVKSLDILSFSSFFSFIHFSKSSVRQLISSVKSSISFSSFQNVPLPPLWPPVDTNWAKHKTTSSNVKPHFMFVYSVSIPEINTWAVKRDLSIRLSDHSLIICRGMSCYSENPSTNSNISQQERGSAFYLVHI